MPGAHARSDCPESAPGTHAPSACSECAQAAPSACPGRASLVYTVSCQWSVRSRRPSAPKSGRKQPDLAVPMSVQVGSKLVGVGPNLWSSSGRSWPNSVQMRSRSAEMLPPKLAGIGLGRLKSAQVEPKSAKSGRSRARLSPNRPNVADLGPNWGELGPNLAGPQPMAMFRHMLSNELPEG